MTDTPDPAAPKPKKPPKPINGKLRYKLTIAYDGSGFHGWQKQHPPGGPPLRTVQGVVEDAIRSITGPPVRLVGASRTDAGVHALGQVAQVDLTTPIPVDRLPKAINGRLPGDVELRAIEVAPWAFNAIQDVTTKQYRYTIHNARTRPLGDRHKVFHCDWPLDLDRMNDAAARMIGTHDFHGLASSKHGRESTVRTVHRCDVHRDPTDPDKLHLLIEGSGFLYNQVRIMAGTLVEVARGQFEPARVDTILADADRSLAGPTLGPEGLTLMWIKYGE